MSREALLPSEARSYEEFAAALDRLDKAWESYVRGVRELMEEWEKVKVKLLERISKTEGLIEAIKNEVEELRVEIALGLRSEEESKEEVERLEERRARLEDRLKALRGFLEDVETRVREHRERVMGR